MDSSQNTVLKKNSSYSECAWEVGIAGEFGI